MSILRADEFTLGDRYRRERGTILLSGIQALVRLPIDRHRFDRRAGRRTGTFISGYQGSPLGTYDLTLQRELALLSEHDITHVPGVNEELAATAAWGSQQDTLGDLAGRDGIVSIWYGKSPGVDRCGDVFRHANLMGVDPRGGAIVLAGDDPSSKSSTIPSASEAALAAANIPVLFPGNVQETLDLGQHAISMSRTSGLWVGLKIVTNVADGFSTAEVSPDRFDPVVPDVAIDGQPWTYRQGGSRCLLAASATSATSSMVGPKPHVRTRARQLPRRDHRRCRTVSATRHRRCRQDLLRPPPGAHGLGTGR